MKYKINKKYIFWGITAFLVLAAAIVFHYGLSKLALVGTLFLSLLSVLTPIIYGFVIAYLLTPAVNFIEKKIFYPILYGCFKIDVSQKKQLSKLIRMISIFITLALTIFVLYQLLYMLIPELVNSITGMISSAPSYWDKSEKWIKKLLRNQPAIEHAFLKYSDSVLNYLTKDLLPHINEILMSFSVGIWDVVVVLKNIVIGGIVSIYIMNSKETFAASAKKLLYSMFSCKKANLFLHNLRFVNTKFGGFIIGKIIDSFIIGVICFVVISIMDMPYAVLISVIIGVTNVIPFFGPYFGAIPSAFLILIVDPVKCIYFIIFIIILQTFDGNVLGPKILSESTDLSSFWIIFSILVGGGLFGVIGMFIGVPVFAVIYAVVNSCIDRSLENKQLSVDNEQYLNLKSIEMHMNEQNQPVYEFVYLKNDKEEFKQLKFAERTAHTEGRSVVKFFHILKRHETVSEKKESQSSNESKEEKKN